MENGFICKKNPARNTYDVGIYDTMCEWHKVGEYMDERYANHVARYMNGEITPEGFTMVINAFRKWGVSCDY